MAKSYIDALLGENEKILLITSQHWFILASNIFAELLFILIVIVAASTASVFFPLYMLIFWIAAGIIIILPVLAMLRDILNWRFRMYAVTNLRVMQVSGIINKNVIDSSLEKVNDVKLVQSAFGRVFNYGDIEILTASELGVNLFKRIADPIHFKTVMLNAKERLEHTPFPLSPSSVQSEVFAAIQQLDDLRKRGVLSEEEFQLKKKELLSKV